MSAAGIKKVTICGNRGTRLLRASVTGADIGGLTVDFHEDEVPRGAAGCVRDAALATDAGTLLVADGTTIPTANLLDMLEKHLSERAAMTVVVHAGEARPSDTARVLLPGGAYLVERAALEEVPAQGFHDLKENLIPRLYATGRRVVTYVAQGHCPRVIDARTYLSVNHWVVERLVDTPPPEYASFGTVLAHPGARVARTSRLVGPVVLGAGARVLGGATLVGPVVIGAGTVVGEGAMVSRSVVWPSSSIGERAVVDECLLQDGARIPSNARVFRSLMGTGPGRLPTKDAALAHRMADRAALFRLERPLTP